MTLSEGIRPALTCLPCRAGAVFCATPPPPALGHLKICLFRPLTLRKEILEILAGERFREVVALPDIALQAGQDVHRCRRLDAFSDNLETEVVGHGRHRFHDHSVRSVFLDIQDRTTTSGDLGLQSIAFHPSYEENGYFYLHYSDNNPNRSVISRFERSQNDPDVADPASPPEGCYFHPRCPYSRERCQREEPAFHDIGNGHRVACHFAEELELKGVEEI